LKETSKEEEMKMAKVSNREFLEELREAKKDHMILGTTEDGRTAVIMEVSYHTFGEEYTD